MIAGEIGDGEQILKMSQICGWGAKTFGHANFVENA